MSEERSKLQFVLLDLKGSHLAAIVFLKFKERCVRNVYATGNLIVACSEDVSFCGKLQLSFQSLVFNSWSVQQGLSPQLLLLRSSVGPKVRGQLCPAQHCPDRCGIMTHSLLILFELWFSYM